MQVLKYTGVNLLLIVFYFFIGQLLVKDHDAFGAGMTSFFLLLVHIIFCFLTGVIMHMRGKNDKAKMYLTSASIPVLLVIILYIIAVMGF